MATQFEDIFWSEVTNILTIVNTARTKHGLSAVTMTKNSKPRAVEDFNTLLNYLIEANNRIVGTRPVMNITQATSKATLLQANTMNSLSTKATEVYNTCTCNAYCTCDCARCSCDCARCSCDCNDCACQSNCACNCNLAPCTCDGQGVICTQY